MTFLDPERLLLLLGVAAVGVAYVVMARRRGRYALRFTNLALLDKVAPRRPGWRRHLPAAAFLLMAGLLVTAFARPQADVEVPRERATVLVAVDVSVSMQAEDVEPTRFAAAQEAADRFVEDLPEGFSVGLVAFAGSARLAVPPTPDREAVRTGIEALALGPGTAIGEAVYTSLDGIAAADVGTSGVEGPPPARVVLLSDGTNTEGRSPEAAAEAARAAGVPVSTIAYGTPAGQVEVDGRSIPVPVDVDALAALAGATGGEAYAAASGDELATVYEDIGSSIGYRTERREVSSWFVGAALLAALLAALGSLRWFARLP